MAEPFAFKHSTAVQKERKIQNELKRLQVQQEAERVERERKKLIRRAAAILRQQRATTAQSATEFQAISANSCSMLGEESQVLTPIEIDDGYEIDSVDRASCDDTHDDIDNSRMMKMTEQDVTKKSYFEQQ